MNLEKLKSEIILEEGSVKSVYLCSENHPTFGIGHLITKNDPEFGQPVGTEVSDTRVQEVFETDISIVIKDCEMLYPQLYDLPEEVQHCIANMCFQLGRPRLSKFKKMKKAIDDRNYELAASEMLNSLWSKQTPNRANRLADRMRKAYDSKET